MHLQDQHQFQLHYRANERFALCSTFKVLLVANVLHRIDQHQESLSEEIEDSDQETGSHRNGDGCNLSQDDFFK